MMSSDPAYLLSASDLELGKLHFIGAISTAKFKAIMDERHPPEESSSNQSSVFGSQKPAQKPCFAGLSHIGDIPLTNVDSDQSPANLRITNLNSCSVE